MGIEDKQNVNKIRDKNDKTVAFQSERQADSSRASGSIDTGSPRRRRAGQEPELSVEDGAWRKLVSDLLARPKSYYAQPGDGDEYVSQTYKEPSKWDLLYPEEKRKVKRFGFAVGGVSALVLSMWIGIQLWKPTLPTVTMPKLPEVEVSVPGVIGAWCKIKTDGGVGGLYRDSKGKVVGGASEGQNVRLIDSKVRQILIEGILMNAFEIDTEKVPGTVDNAFYEKPTPQIAYINAAVCEGTNSELPTAQPQP